jgi:hypothetical protein
MSDGLLACLLGTAGLLCGGILCQRVGLFGLSVLVLKLDGGLVGGCRGWPWYHQQSRPARPPPTNDD